MGSREFTYWMAFYKRENREQARAREQATDNALAADMARGLAGRHRG